MIPILTGKTSSGSCNYERTVAKCNILKSLLTLAQNVTSLKT